MGEINIKTLTLEQYLALDRNDTRGGIKRHDIGKNIKFEIKGQFLRELGNNTLSGNETKDVIEHIGRVLEIASLFNTHGVLGDDIMLWASISVMLFSMFKRLGLANPKPVNIVIEMADRSMQSPKGIVKNVLVKIHKFNFPVNFVILDIIEDNKVPIILGRPMLATAHPRIDVFEGKFSLEVGTEQIVFNANEGATPSTVSPVCVINDYDIIDDSGGPENLEKLLMNDDINEDLGDFLQDNDLLPNFDAPEVISLS
ncbi:putative reverse transcriptase domain-containing protein [Tanacetum coccineum]|uniref:Reverse transcriptase domain-containing protein n=1 Tax=Tanacetum coccineum TaxID=301880 RepID=A0ABQ5A813_9ASTR